MAGIVGTITSINDFLSKTQVCLSVKPNQPQVQSICLDEDRQYSIPAFQREVRWDDNNLKMLLFDLSRGNKFLGNIILTVKSDHTCEIIDGQQRTTVLMLIVTCIKKKFGKQISTPELCPLRNEGFTGFQQLLDKDFDLQAITQEEWETIHKSDDYNQFPRIQRLWDTIASSELLSDRHKAQGLLDNLCKSEFNIIASYSIIANVLDMSGIELSNTITNKIIYEIVDYTNETASVTPLLNLSDFDRFELTSKINSLLAFDVSRIKTATDEIEASLNHVKRIRKKMERSSIESYEGYLQSKSNLNEEKAEKTMTLVRIDAELQKYRADKAVSAAKLAKAKASYEAVLKKQSINDISARALLAFDELQTVLYEKSIRKVEEGFQRYFNSLINKSDTNR